MDRGVVVGDQYEDGLAIRPANPEGWSTAAASNPPSGVEDACTVYAVTNMPPYTQFDSIPFRNAIKQMA